MNIKSRKKFFLYSGHVPQQKIFLVAIITLLLTVSVFAHPPDILWTKTYGGQSGEECYSIQQTSDGGYIITGWTESYGAGGRDVYLIKTDSNGDTLWTKTYGRVNFEEGYSVQQTSDGGYIIAGRKVIRAYLDDDVYLIKTDANGDTLWMRTYGGALSDIGNSVQSTVDDEYIIAGYTHSFGAGNADVYLIKTGRYGDTIWTRTYGGVNGDLGCSIQPTPDGGYIIVGNTASFGRGGDVYLLKIDANGDTIWTKTYGGDNFDEGYSVQPTSDGGYIISGRTYSFGAGLSDVYLIKTDINGDTLWTRTYGGPDNDWGGQTVRQTIDGGYIIAGYTGSFGAGLWDIYIIKTDANGDTIWTLVYGDTANDYCTTIQPTSDGGYIIGGHTSSFGAGSYDVCLIKLGPETGIKEENSLQKTCFISQVEPNPFRDKALIKFELIRKSDMHISIYNLFGGTIRTILNKIEDEGLHQIIWDGKDNSNKNVAKGVYFIRFEADHLTSTKKIVKN